MNQFFVTLGQVTAVTVSASFVVPMYQYYSIKFKSWLLSQETINEDFQGYDPVDTDMSDCSDTDVELDTENQNQTESEPVLVHNSANTTTVSEPQTI